MTTPADVYRTARADLAAALDGLDDASLGAPVPACPGWSVRDVVGHLAGLAADVVAGTVAGPPTDEHTMGQVVARRGRPLADVFAEWEEHAPAIEAAIDAGAVIVALDAAVHHLDVVLALGAGDRAAVPASAAFVTRLTSKAVDGKVRAAGLPALRIVADGFERVAGDGDPAVTLAAPTVELSRVLSGRRSETQVRALAWTGDPAPYLPLLSALPVAKADVREAVPG